MSAWPEPVERVSSFIRAAGADARIEELAEGTHTAANAAVAVGCGIEQIVKSLVLMCDGRAVVALVPGDRRADPEKVARSVDAEKARIASAEQVKAATGFEPGGVAPFPLPENVVVLMDRALLDHRVVWAGAGSSTHVLGVAPRELARLSRASSVDVTQGDSYHAENAKER